DATGFLSRIAEIASQQAGTLVLPMTEATTLPISARREMLVSAGARLVVPDHSDVLRAFNKDDMVRLASSFGLAVPKTVLVRNTDDARRAGMELKFPVVLKPRSSVESQANGGIRITGRPRYARDAHELLARYWQLTEICSQVLAQEFVDG